MRASVMCILAALFVPGGMAGQELEAGRFDHARWESPRLVEGSVTDRWSPVEPVGMDRVPGRERSRWTSPLVGALVGTAVAAGVLAIDMRGNDDPFDPVSLVAFRVLPGTVVGAIGGWVFDRVVRD